MQIISKPLTNYSSGRKGYKPEAIVLHTLSSTALEALETYSNPNSRQSMHYIVTTAGFVWQCVQDTNTAWHCAGLHKPSWKQVKSNVNPDLYTIGVACELTKEGELSATAFTTLAELLSHLAYYWDLSLSEEVMIGHNQLNSLAHANCPAPALNLPVIIQKVRLGILETDSNDQFVARIEQLSREITQYKTELANLELICSGLESTNRNLREQIAQLVESQYGSADIAEQYQQLASEIYDLQQERNRLYKELSRLSKAKQPAGTSWWTKVFRNRAL